MVKNKLSEKAKEYNSRCGNIMQDLLDDGYLKRDIIVAINHCVELNSMDIGDDVMLFIEGILWERKRQKELRSSKVGEE